MNYISATNDFNTYDKHVPLPLMRRTFEISEKPYKVLLEIGSLGYYEAHINGINVTKGEMAPYRSSPYDYVYFDKYDITECINIGKNVLGVILGNGLQNSVETTWNFDKLPWRSSPAVSFEITVLYEDRQDKIISDEKTVCADSPIIFNDFHYGEHYDARLEIDGWDVAEFDDSCWSAAILRKKPVGEKQYCDVEPITAQFEIKPVDIFEYEDGFVYDFGINHAGLTRLCINGERGQKITTCHFEVLLENKQVYTKNLQFHPDKRIQEDVYICKGGEQEIHTPRFTYHGFRYVLVKGITKKQATKDLLTFVVMHSDLESRGHFECDNEVINKLQEITVRSDYSNFHYFPTDCPHREKNGWTADAALSSEQLLMNMSAEKSFTQWLHNIYKNVTDKGALPGIIPTGGWGFDWGNGPAWDQVIVTIPYYTYKYTGNTDIFKGIEKPLMKYILYTKTRLNEKGLIAIGLGDWCQTGRSSGAPTTPLEVTDSIMLKDIADKAAFIYDILDLEDYKDVCTEYSKQLKDAIRAHLIDFEKMTVKCNTQTGQAMAMFYGIFNADEMEKATARLVRLIKDDDTHMNVGVLGGRVLFRVLSDNGEHELAYRLITRRDYPSYANLLEQGATTLWENFRPEKSMNISSRNHHFWGDISAWFYTYIGGLRINPTARDINNVNIAPVFLKNLNYAKASHILPAGEVLCEWKRNENNISVKIKVPEGVWGKVILPTGICELKSGEWTV